MKHLVDLDEELLRDAMHSLGKPTIKATVEEALRIATEQRARKQREALEKLGEIFSKIPDFDRSEAW